MTNRREYVPLRSSHNLAMKTQPFPAYCLEQQASPLEQAW